MPEKEVLLTKLNDEFTLWNNLLSSLTEEEITTHNLSNNWSIKDTLAHLFAWQQISIARLQAALTHSDPSYPEWPTKDPDSEKDTDMINDWIYEKYKNQSWQSIYAQWQKGFRTFLDIAHNIPKKDYVDTDQFSWLNGYPLSAVLSGSLEHHQEHRESLRKDKEEL